MVKSIQTLNATRHELLDEVDLTDDLRHLETANDEDYDALKVVRVDEKLLFGDIVATPEKTDFFANLSGAAIVDPFQLTHWVLKTRELL